MSTCSKCGQQIPDDSKFCTYCGSTVGSKEQQTQSYNNSNDKPKNTITIILIVIIAVLLIVFAVCLVMALRYSLSDRTININTELSSDVKNNSSIVSTTPNDSDSKTKPDNNTGNNDTTNIIIIENDVPDFIFPYSNSVRLTDSDLIPLDKYTLAIARNEIYARHGYIFHQQPFVNYFNSKSWYHPNSSFKGTDSELNSVEIYNIQLILKYEKLSNVNNSPSNSQDFVFPNSSTVKLTDKDLASLSKYWLGIARNEIYARHGYVFHQPPYVDYFNSKSWYHPNSSFKGTYKELNSIEIYNIELIIKYEKMK